MDLGTLDVVYATPARHEDKSPIGSFLKTTHVELSYPPRGMVADLALANIFAIWELFPGLLFQGCVVHVERDIKLFLLPGTERTPDHQKVLIRKVLYAPSPRRFRSMRS